MGMARNAGSGASRWTNWINARNRAARIPGTPVPGTGGHHSRRKSHTGGNKVGAITHPNKEWSSKSRKQEEHQTGIAKRAETDAIAEGLAEMVPTEAEWVEAADAARCWADDMEFNLLSDTYEDIWERDQAYDDMWADDGDIYSGTYQGDM